MTVPSGIDPRSIPLQDDDIRPIVALPRPILSTPLIVTLGVMLALALFLFLNAQRVARQDRLVGRSDIPFQTSGALPPLDIARPPEQSPFRIVVREPEPAMPPPVAIASAVPIPHPTATIIMAPPQPQLPPTEGRARSNDAALVVDTTSGSGAAVNSVSATAGDGAAPATDGDAARASLIRNRGSLIPQGTIIAAVLETPLNSDRPGMARALVGQDARSFDGSRVLIPRGSRLIGEFKADTNLSQRRILVTWTRMIRPDGVAIRIGSPGADALGGAGIAGRVNTHFLERFSSAILQSALTVGVNLASQLNSNPNAIYLGLPAQATQMGQQLTPNSNRSATVKVREGAEISIFVARDLDFGGTPAVN